MKRHGNLYPLIYDMDNIRLAHKNAKKGKAHYREVREIDKDPERYFRRIHYMLKNKAFHNSRYSVFHKQDGSKVREIYRLPYFPDRIIHHCIMQVIEPILFKNLINDTYACIKGRGIHKGVKRIKAALRDEENTKYCLKLDIQKFYPSINHEVLIHLLKQRIKDDDLIWLLSEIVHSAPGVPIGNYLSQHFGNLYLSELDHKCKEQWFCKYYYRYCDDVVILHNSKQFLHNVLSNMRQHLTSSILTIKRNWQIFPVDVRGIDFLGYRFFRHYILLRKRIATRFKRKMLNIKELNKKTMNVIMSYKGWLKWANCFNLEHRYIDSILVK
jgi:RNA-directed DNA polymerase